MASILEYEANRSEDYPKVARVLYNRLDQGMPLQLDSTVSYVSKRSGDVWTTAAERSNTSAYNTYANTGLPPGPIGSPGEETIEAALSPAKGDWLYFVPDYDGGHHPLLRDLRRAPEVGREAARRTARERGLLSVPARSPASSLRGRRLARSRTRCRRRCTGRRTPSSGSTGPTTTSRSTRPGSRSSSPGSTPSWRGLSLTMPLKRTVVPLLDTSDDWVRLSGVANTLVLDEGSRHGFNTDIPGAIAAMRGAAARRRRARRSCWAAERRRPRCCSPSPSWAARRPRVLVRDPARAEETVAVVSGHPHAPGARPWAPSTALAALDADLLVSTIPGEAQTPDLRGRLRAGARPCSRSSTTRGRRRSPRAVTRRRPATWSPGLDLLAHQAVRPGAADDRASACRSTCSARPATGSSSAGLCRSTRADPDASPSLRAWTGSIPRSWQAAAVCLVACAVLGWFVPALIGRVPEPEPEPEPTTRRADAARPEQPGDGPPSVRALVAGAAPNQGALRRDRGRARVWAGGRPPGQGCSGLPSAPSLGWTGALLYLVPLVPIGVALMIVDWRTTLLPDADHPPDVRAARGADPGRRPDRRRPRLALPGRLGLADHRRLVLGVLVAVQRLGVRRRPAGRRARSGAGLPRLVRAADGARPDPARRRARRPRDRHRRPATCAGACPTGRSCSSGRRCRS